MMISALTAGRPEARPGWSGWAGLCFGRPVLNPNKVNEPVLARVSLCALIVVATLLTPLGGARSGSDAGGSFEFHGDVISVGVPGQGLVLALRDRNVAVHGLGPIWFWDSMEWPWPVVGDSVVARGRDIYFQGRTYHVAQTLRFAGYIFSLRDPSNGLPRWCGQGLNQPLKEQLP